MVIQLRTIPLTFSRPNIILNRTFQFYILEKTKAPMTLPLYFVLLQSLSFGSQMGTIESFSGTPLGGISVEFASTPKRLAVSQADGRWTFEPSTSNSPLTARPNHKLASRLTLQNGHLSVRLDNRSIDGRNQAGFCPSQVVPSFVSPR